MSDDRFLSDYRALTGDGFDQMADKKLLLRNLAAWTAGVEGAIAECGCFRGVSAWFLADGTRDTGKVVHLFDSFEGLLLPAPGADDGSYCKERQPLRQAKRSASELWTLTGGTGGLAPRLDPGTIPPTLPTSGFLSCMSMSTSTQPHRDSIQFSWPRLTPGGLMLFDDYGSEYCPGARRAVDEAFAQAEIVESPSGQAFVIQR